MPQGPVAANPLEPRPAELSAACPEQPPMSPRSGLGSSCLLPELGPDPRPGRLDDEGAQLAMFNSGNNKILLITADEGNGGPVPPPPPSSFWRRARR